jgi:hypothetical protein
MPYLAVAALRLQGASVPRAPALILIGLLAGIGFALKPYFLAVPALVELLFLARFGWRSMLARVESLTLGLTVLVYVITAGLLLKDYLEFTIGLTLSTYWAYDTVNFTPILERFVRVAQPAVFGLIIALLTRTWTPQHTVLLLACFGYSISYFVQSKGFVYHAYPILVCSVTFFGICFGHGLARAWASWRQARGAPRLAQLILVALLALPPIKQIHDDILQWYVRYNIAWGSTGRFRQAVIEMVEQFAPRHESYFYAFSTHPFPGFPTASYTRAEWSGRSIVQPFVPAYARLDEVTDQALRTNITRSAEYQRQMVREDFERRPPSIVFVERNRMRLGMNGRQFDDIAFYLKDPRFQNIWENYQEIEPLGPLRVFVLRSDPTDHGSGL